MNINKKQLDKLNFKEDIHINGCYHLLLINERSYGVEIEVDFREDIINITTSHDGFRTVGRTKTNVKTEEDLKTLINLLRYEDEK